MALKRPLKHTKSTYKSLRSTNNGPISTHKKCQRSTLEGFIRTQNTKVAFEKAQEAALNSLKSNKIGQKGPRSTQKDQKSIQEGPRRPKKAQ